MKTETRERVLEFSAFLSLIVGIILLATGGTAPLFAIVAIATGAELTLAAKVILVGVGMAVTGLGLVSLGVTLDETRLSLR